MGELALRGPWPPSIIGPTTTFSSFLQDLSDSVSPSSAFSPLSPSSSSSSAEVRSWAGVSWAVRPSRRRFLPPCSSASGSSTSFSPHLSNIATSQDSKRSVDHVAAIGGSRRKRRRRQQLASMTTTMTTRVDDNNNDNSRRQQQRKKNDCSTQRHTSTSTVHSLTYHTFISHAFIYRHSFSSLVAND